MAPATSRAALMAAPQAELVVEEQPMPVPGEGEVLIRNRAIALNPIDWKRQAYNFMIHSYPVVLGNDLSGEIAAVGAGVTDFKVGDRVMAISHSTDTGNNDHAAFRSHSVVKADVTSKLPAAISFNQAATLPTAAGTTTAAMFHSMAIPRPGATPAAAGGILIWGGATSVGQAAIQIARLTGLTVFTTASEKHHATLRKFGATAVVDYRSPSAVDDLVAAAKAAGTPIAYAIDCVISKDTLEACSQVFAKAGAAGDKKLAFLIPWPEDAAKPEGVELLQIGGGVVWGARIDLGRWLYHERLPAWLESGEVVPSKFKVVPGGLDGLQNGMNELKKTGGTAEKLVVEL